MTTNDTYVPAYQLDASEKARLIAQYNKYFQEYGYSSKMHVKFRDHLHSELIKKHPCENPAALMSTAADIVALAFQRYNAWIEGTDKRWR